MIHPDQFLLDHLAVFPAEVISKLQDQAATIDQTVPRLLNTLRAALPQFAAVLEARIG